MYAIIEAGGRQVRVAQGEKIRVDRMSVDAGETVTFDRVLMVGGDSIRVGRPTLEGARVTGRVIEHGRGPKIIVQKYMPKRRHKVVTGHRQDYTEVAIEAISLG